MLEARLAGTKPPAERGATIAVRELLRGAYRHCRKRRRSPSVTSTFITRTAIKR